MNVWFSEGQLDNPLHLVGLLLCLGVGCDSREFRMTSAGTTGGSVLHPPASERHAQGGGRGAGRWHVPVLAQSPPVSCQPSFAQSGFQGERHYKSCPGVWRQVELERELNQPNARHLCKPLHEFIPQPPPKWVFAALDERALPDAELNGRMDSYGPQSRMLAGRQLI